MIRNGRPGNVLALIGLLAVLFHAFIPAGMMPDMAARSAGLHFILCDGTMPSMDMAMDGMTMPQAHGHASHPGPENAPAPCPYFMAALAAFVLIPILVALGLILQRIERPLAFPTRPPDETFPGSASPRGPPAF